MTDIGHRSKQTDATPPAPSSGFECPFIFMRKAAQVCPDLFVSAKTATAIPARHPALLDALIQASLDAPVRSIAYIPWASVATELIQLDAVVVHRDDGRFLLDVVPATRIRDLKQEATAQIALAELGLKPIVLTAEEIRRDTPTLGWSGPIARPPSRSACACASYSCCLTRGRCGSGSCSKISVASVIPHRQ